MNLADLDDTAAATELDRLELEDAATRARLARPEALAAAAAWYAAHGQPVFPVHHPVDGACSCGQACGSPAKHPLTRRGLRDATTDPDRVAAWWDRWPAANVGLVTGQLVDVIDVDGVPGYASLAKLLHRGCPAGCCLERTCPGDGTTIPPLLGRVSTPRGGQHLYIAATGDGNATAVLPGLDYRGRGGYVLAPPSVGVSGRRYTAVEPIMLPAAAAVAA